MWRACLRACCGCNALRCSDLTTHASSSDYVYMYSESSDVVSNNEVGSTPGSGNSGVLRNYYTANNVVTGTYVASPRTPLRRRQSSAEPATPPATGQAASNLFRADSPPTTRAGNTADYMYFSEARGPRFA